MICLKEEEVVVLFVLSPETAMWLDGQTTADVFRTFTSNYRTE